MLVELHQRGIYRLLLGLTRDPDAAETLTQECFLKAFRSRAGFRHEASAKTWLTRIAINLAHDHRRSRRMQFWNSLFRRNQVASGKDGPAELAPPLVEALADSRASAERRLLAREQMAAVWRAVGRLPHQQRTVFLLRFVEEMPLEEIAQTMGVSLASVKTHLRRATITIRRAVKAWGEV